MTPSFSQMIRMRGARYDPEITRREDKYQGRLIAAALGCPVPALYQYVQWAADLDLAALSGTCVVKPTHLADGRGVLCLDGWCNLTDGHLYDPFQVKALMTLALRAHWGGPDWEVSCTRITPGILVEELLRPARPGFLLPEELKCFVFGGRTEYILFESGKGTPIRTKHTLTRDWEWSPEPLRATETPRTELPPRPPTLDEILKWADRLGADFGDFVRVDFLATDHGPVFDEFTFHPGGGFLYTPYADAVLGRLWAAARRRVRSSKRPAGQDRL